MTKEELQSMPKWAGIYFIRNKVNNGYYIGQTLVIRKTLLKHFEKKQNSLLYNDIIKYGIDNFEVGILEDFKTGFTKEDLKNKLNELEAKYIKKYNSIYNQPEEIKESPIIKEDKIKKYYFTNGKETIVSIYPTLDNLKSIININEWHEKEK